MAAIHVRRLGNDVIRRLERRAGANNRSLEGEARHILEGAVTDGAAARRASFLVLAARLRRQSEDRAQTPAEALIREDREHGHHAAR